ncbi:MAG TPA: efflux RND transporter periplasmic adaptor subunit [Candidatus Megaira endosymbiont of Hartmannula sinica]|nr:efflux RND transporter periplasmic adaptor subunit [Candidatus Megaera endosymbiont of Hartmannula sinica]
MIKSKTKSQTLFLLLKIFGILLAAYLIISRISLHLFRYDKNNVKNYNNKATNSKEINDIYFFLPRIKSVEVKEKDFYETVSLTGRISSLKSRDYYANSFVSGEVDFITDKQGKKVNRGDVLIKIDEKVIKSSLDHAINTKKTALYNYNRDKKLFEKNFISNKKLDDSYNKMQLAISNLESIKDKYDNMIITAPFDGIMGVSSKQVGDNVKNGDYLFSIIGNNSDYTISLDIPENIAKKIDTSQDKALIKKNNLNNENNQAEYIETRLDSISNYINPYGSVAGKIILKQQDLINNYASFPHNSYIKVNLIFNIHKALSLPEYVVLKDNKGNFVYKIIKNKNNETQNDTVKKIYVDTGTRTEGRVEIISKEIKVNDKIVSEGLTKISDNKEILDITNNKDK